MEENKDIINEETVDEEVKEEKQAVNPDDPLSSESIENIEAMLGNLQQIVSVMESQWMASAKEFNLNDTHMRQLAVYNEEHKDPKPDDMKDEDYDPMNGIDKITRDDAIAIFGEGHPIIGIDDSHTKDRVKGAANDFYQWVYAMKEYRNVKDAYVKLIELEEEKALIELRQSAEVDPDPESKKKKLESIHKYYYMKYLDFLKDDVDDFKKKKIKDALIDEQKCSYLINRTRDRLSQLDISQKFILELSQFEKRYLDHKYDKCSNVLLLYFMNLIVYSDCTDPKKEDRAKVTSMVMTLDFFIRNQLSEEVANRVKENIIALEDQFIDIVPEVVFEGVVPPVTPDEAKDK